MTEEKRTVFAAQIQFLLRCQRKLKTRSKATTRLTCHFKTTTILLISEVGHHRFQHIHQIMLHRRIHHHILESLKVQSLHRPQQQPEKQQRLGLPNHLSAIFDHPSINQFSHRYQQRRSDLQSSYRRNHR